MKVLSTPAQGKLGNVTSKLIISFSPMVLSTYMSEVVFTCGGKNTIAPQLRKFQAKMLRADLSKFGKFRDG